VSKQPTLSATGSGRLNHAVASCFLCSAVVHNLARLLEVNSCPCTWLQSVLRSLNSALLCSALPCRGLDRTRLLYAAHTRRLAARADLDVQQQAWVPAAEPSVAQLGLRLPSFANRPASFMRTLSNKVMAAGRRSSSPHSPTGVDALTRSSLSQPGVPGGRAPFTAGGGVCDEGPVRSRSSLSAGGSVGSLVNTLGKGLRGDGLSEAGRAGFGASSLHGSWLSGGFGRTRSPQLTHSSRSESAAAGAILQSSQRLAELRGRPVNSTQGPAVIDAAEQPEGGMSAAAAAGRTAELASARPAGGSAPWLVDGSCDGAGAWEAGSTGAGGHGSSTQLDAQEGPGSTSLRPCQGLNDPLLGTVHIPPIHTLAPPGKGLLCCAPACRVALQACMCAQISP
jgi:hypothetical protein